MEYRGKRLDDSAGTTTPLRLLLVEPDPRTALWISEMLRASWHEPMVIAHAERLADAIGSLSLPTPGCVLLDVTGMGEEWPAAAEQLRGVAAEVPLLLISDRADDEAALQALRAGAQDYLPRGICARRSCGGRSSTRSSASRPRWRSCTGRCTIR